MHSYNTISCFCSVHYYAVLQITSIYTSYAVFAFCFQYYMCNYNYNLAIWRSGLALFAFAHYFRFDFRQVSKVFLFLKFI